MHHSMATASLAAVLLVSGSLMRALNNPAKVASWNIARFVMGRGRKAMARSRT